MYTDRSHEPLVSPSSRLYLALVAGIGASVLSAGCSEPTQPDTKERCDAFSVYAQNRWAPLGAAEREIPDLKAAKVASHLGNQIIKVDAWTHADKPVYPHNPEPWNSDIWFHVVEGKWVNFAAVRGEETQPDATGHKDGGRSAPTPPSCEIPYDSLTQSQPAATVAY